MPKRIECPFFEKEANFFVLCKDDEAQTEPKFKSFGNKEDKKAFIKCTCADKKGYMGCEFYQELEELYEKQK